MSNKGLHVVDLFAGPGGADLGIQAALPHVRVTGVEWDDAACATRKAAGLDTVQASVSELNPRDFADAQGLWASPPCQAWSMAGKRLAEQDQGKIGSHVERCRDGWAPYDVSDYADERTPLVLEPLRWVDEIRPAWIAMEQVPPVLGLWLQYVSVFRQWGYRAWAGVLNAADYGVPQTRRRAILMAARWKFGAPDPTHAENPEPAGLFGEQRLPWVTMATALGIPDDMQTFTGATAQPLGIRKPRSTGVPSQTVTGRGNAYYWANGNRRNSAVRPVANINNLSFTTNRHSTSEDWATSRSLDSPAPTIGCRDGGENAGWIYKRPATTVVPSFAPDVIAAPGYRTAKDGPRQDAPYSVQVTIEQAATLQGFPEDFPWQGPRTKQYEQVGNAVPPPLAQAVVGALTKGMQDE